MNAPLYDARILALATQVPDVRLDAPMGVSEKRSPLCGSRVTVAVNLDGARRVREIGLTVHACALGQASAALLAADIVGRDAAELAGARDALTAWLAGTGPLPPWPGMDALARARDFPARHGSIRLAFEAAAAAALMAGGAG